MPRVREGSLGRVWFHVQLHVELSGVLNKFMSRFSAIRRKIQDSSVSEEQRSI